MRPLWIDAILRDSAIRDDFQTYLDSRERRLLESCLEAKSLEELSEYRGQLKALRDLRRMVTNEEKEEIQRARYLGQTPKAH